MNRKWVSTQDQMPEDAYKIYFFTEDEGIFLGHYQYQQYRYESPHVFLCSGKILTEEAVSFWMLYDHKLKDVIPLPPDYNKIKNIEEIKIPDSQQKFNFTYQIAGDIK
jgi:hypothetical protein